MVDKMYICKISLERLVFTVVVLFKISNINGHPINGDKCTASSGNYIYYNLVILVQALFLNRKIEV